MDGMTVADFKARAVEFGGAGVLKRSALNIRDGGGVFERVLGSGAYRTVLEIGTYRGISSAFMAQFCDRVITIDLYRGRMEQLGEMLMFARAGFWKRMGVADKIDLHLVNDNLEKAELIRGLSFDLAFIDGAHDRSVADDFAMTKRCGHVLFHDADDNGPNKPNHVHEFIRTLPQDQVEFIDRDIFALWTATISNGN